MSERPTGTVTFLFTDIEGSTRRWEHQRSAMQQAFARQEEIMRSTMSAHGGYVYKMIGDAFQVAFSTAPAALEAALAAQYDLLSEPWGEIQPVRVRMALHTGDTEERGDDYVGPLLNRVARLMNAAHGGQVLMTQATFELLRDNLPEGVHLRDLGEHRLKDLERPERVYQMVAPGLPQDFPPLKTLDSHPNNLPISLTSFIGRERELTEVEEMLSATRLLTLSGPGGVGKTRLALQVAAHCLEEYQDGVYYVPLAAVAIPDHVVPSIAGAIKFNFDTHMGIEDTKVQLLDYLKQRNLLLLLDNFEQLVDGADLLVDILQSAPNIKLLVTSRQRLNLQGEWIFEVGGVDYPHNGHQDGGKEYPAVRLFLERARQLDPHFRLSELNQLDIHRVCRSVEGIPLAIELAAGWISVLSPREIADEITKNLDFLVSTQRDLPDKHRSIRAVFDHSWRLLSKEQCLILCQLAIFRGGFTRQAADQVAGANLVSLTNFISKSLLRHTDQGRYEIHELLRQYAEDQLNQYPEIRKQAYDRHSRYYIDLLSRHEQDVFGYHLVEIRAELRTEIYNLRQAVEWAVTHWDAKEAKKALYSYYYFNVVQGWDAGRAEFDRLANFIQKHQRIEGTDSELADPVYLTARILKAYFDGLLAHDQESDLICQQYLAILRNLDMPLELCYCLYTLGVNATTRGEYELAKSYLFEALSLVRQFEDHLLTGLILMFLGYTFNELGENDQAEAFFDESIALFEQHENLYCKAFSISKLGLVADDRMDLALARRCHEQGLEIFTRFGDLSGEAYTSSRLSLTSYFEGDYPAAIQYARQGLEKFEELGNRWGIPACLCRIGFPLLVQGNCDEALACFQKAVESALKTQFIHIVGYALIGVACVWVEQGKLEPAAEIFGLIMNHPRTPTIYKKVSERWFHLLEQNLPEDVYQSAIERGKVKDLVEVAQALIKDRHSLHLETMT